MTGTKEEIIKIVEQFESDVDFFFFDMWTCEDVLVESDRLIDTDYQRKLNLGDAMEILKLIQYNWSSDEGVNWKVIEQNIMQYIQEQNNG